MVSREISLRSSILLRGRFIFCARILSEKRKSLYTYCIFSLNDEPSRTFTLRLYTVSVQICHKPINYNSQAISTKGDTIGTELECH